MLRLDRVTKRFGNLRVLDDVSVEVNEGEIFGIAGPNGAGKSTLLNVCTGTLKICSGKIRFLGQKLENISPDRACHLGVGRTFQIPQVLHSLSVFENVETGAWFSSKKRSARERRDFVFSILESTQLKCAFATPAKSADLLTRKRIMLAAALAGEPKIIFMDEPFGGLNADEIETYVNLIQSLKDHSNLTFVIVEHKMRALSKLSHRLMILNFGSVLKMGTPYEVLNDAKVIDTYLGTAAYA